MKKSPLLGSVALIALTLPTMAQDRLCRGEPTEVIFSYYEDSPQPKVECRGGIVGAMDCVADKIANAGDAGWIGATYKVRVTPVVEELPDGSMRVKLELDKPEFRSDPGLPAEARTRAIRESRLMEARLKGFEAIVPPAGSAPAPAEAAATAADAPDANEGGLLNVNLLPFAPDRPQPSETMVASKKLLDAIRKREGGPREEKSGAGSEEAGGSLPSIPVPLADNGLLAAEGPANLTLCNPSGTGSAELPEGLDFQILPGDEPGEWFLRWRLPDGSVAESALAEIIDPETGATTILEANPFGDIRESTLWPDGTLTTDRFWPEGDQSTTTFSPDGTLDHIVREPDGSFTHQTVEPDGSIVTERRDAEGKLIETVTQRPNGWVERVTGAGNFSATLADEEGTTVVETDRSGNTLIARFDKHGNLVEHQGHVPFPDEPGRYYFEKVIGGTDWDQLPQHMKRRFANSERDVDEMLLNWAQRDAAAAQERRKAAEREAADAAAWAETERKLADIAAEQEEADRRAAERQAKWERQQAIEASREKARDLQRQYDEAAARGDKEAMQRIIAEQEEHHEKSHELFMPTEEEARAMDELAALRQQLSDEIRVKAAKRAEAEIAGALKGMDRWDAFTGPGQYLSIGADMQHQTSAATRVALGERAEARARQAVIDEMLNDPSISDAKRAMLLDLREISQVKEEGASRLLMDNARLAAAGYAADVATAITGAKLVSGLTTATNILARQAAGTALRVLPREAGRKAAREFLGVGKTLTERGILEVAGKATTGAAAGLTRVAVGKEASETVARALGTDVGTPILDALSRGSKYVTDNAAVEVVTEGLSRARDAVASGAGALASRIRQGIGQGAVSNSAATAAGREASGATVARVAAPHPADALPPPVSGPQTARRAATLGDDAARARADWARTPQQARAQVVDDMLRNIEQEAASGNPTARQVHKELQEGSLTVELDPAAAQPHSLLENGRVILDPTDGSRLRSGKELAELAVQSRAPRPDSRIVVDELSPDDLARMGDGPAIQPGAPGTPLRVVADELTPDDLARMGDGLVSRPVPVRTAAPRASWVERRQATLHQILDQMYPAGNAPPIHVTDQSGLAAIRSSGIFEQPLKGGATFSPGGRVSSLREGSVAIRVKPGHENFVRFVDTPQGLVPLPADRPGRTYLQNKHLQWLDPGDGPGQERWVDF